VDSVPILRLDRAKGQVDTLAYIHPAKNNTHVSGSGGQTRVMIGMSNPYAPRDEWAVAPDGRIAIVTPEPYRVHWVTPDGRRTTGPVIPYDKVKVTEADKERLQDQQSKRTGMVMRAEVGAAGARSSTRPAAIGDLPKITDWPEYKPPFMQGATEIAPNGDLWVLRSPGEDEIPRYDVFDSSGRLTGHVQLPRRARLVGFGKKSVYIVRLDEDDLQYLQRFAM
jgi:hypothetical protein